MKNYTSIFTQLLVIGFLFLMSACQDDFFDQRPYDSLPVDRAITNEMDMQAASNGMYTQLRNVDLYGRTLAVIGDLMADNTYVSALNSGRYINYANYAMISTQSETSNTWAAAYNAILRANNIINAKLTETATTKQLVGEAYAIRGLVYFDLLRMFSKVSDQNSDGVPIITTFDPNLKPTRAKVSEVFAQIINDLNQAFNLMGAAARTAPYNNTSYMTRYAAKALSAKVYLYQADYANALLAAEEVVKNGGYSLVDPAELGAYWANATPRTDKKETLFEVSFDGVGNLGTNALGYIYDQAGYGDLLATTNLYGLYSTTDVRKALIKPGKRAGQDVLLVAKYSNTRNANDKDDTKVLRYADVLLILAEAQYRTRKEADALATLNQIVKKRDPAFVSDTTTTGTALLDAIITERRKELAFEGDRLHDLNRLNRTIQRGTQYPTNVQTIPIENPRRIMPIPQLERNANPAISQNPGY